ncbi:MAG: arsenate reductase family protein [Oscillospiraceae bacterium]|nr:arsenate reductase family protein [Oscillospiraceae bacterium]
MAAIQIFGKLKCFDTKKALRFFKERGIAVHEVDILRKGLSAGEYRSVMSAVGGDMNTLIDVSSKAYQKHHIAYLASAQAVEDKLFDYPELYKTPIVRNGRRATVGYAPEVWKEWLREDS